MCSSDLYPYYERNEFGAAAEPLRVDWGRFGFDVGGVHFSNEPAPRIDSWEVSVPFWFFALAGLVAPVFAFARWMRRRRRMTAGCCVRCGYDLRASRDRCPECGATIPQRPSAAPVPSLT